MSNLGRKRFTECPAVRLDPSFDLVILVRREVVGVTEDHLSEGLALAHRGDQSRILKVDEWGRCDRTTLGQGRGRA